MYGALWPRLASDGPSCRPFIDICKHLGTPHAEVVEEGEAPLFGGEVQPAAGGGRGIPTYVPHDDRHGAEERSGLAYQPEPIPPPPPPPRAWDRMPWLSSGTALSSRTSSVWHLFHCSPTKTACSALSPQSWAV